VNCRKLRKHVQKQNATKCRLATGLCTACPGPLRELSIALPRAFQSQPGEEVDMRKVEGEKGEERKEVGLRKRRKGRERREKETTDSQKV